MLQTLSYFVFFDKAHKLKEIFLPLFVSVHDCQSVLEDNGFNESISVNPVKSIRLQVTIKKIQIVKGTWKSY